MSAPTEYKDATFAIGKGWENVSTMAEVKAEIEALTKKEVLIQMVLFWVLAMLYFARSVEYKQKQRPGVQ